MATTMQLSIQSSHCFQARKQQTARIGRTPALQALIPRFQQRTSRSSPVKAVQTEEKPSTQQEDKPDVAKFADSIGLPTDEGIFGFKPFSEAWVGRLAMLGFITSLVGELFTGKGTLGQLGVATPSVPALTALVTLSLGATLFATVDTLNKANKGKLSEQDVSRYRNFLGLQSDAEINKEANDLKKRGDFTSPLSLTDVEEAQRQVTPADRFLGDERPAADAAAAELKANDERAASAASTGTSVLLQAKNDVLEQELFGRNPELAYARGVELTNGRWAMLGFLGTTIIEAATGLGIVGQIIVELKLIGLLGAESGF